MRWSTVLWVIVPGVGQIHLGRAGRGILLFTLFIALLNTYLLCPLLIPDTVVRTTLLALTVLLWLISAVDYMREASEEDLIQAGRRTEEHDDEDDENSEVGS